MLAIYFHLYYTNLYQREQHLYLNFLVHGSVNPMENMLSNIKVWPLQEATGLKKYLQNVNYLKFHSITITYTYIHLRIFL